MKYTKFMPILEEKQRKDRKNLKGHGGNHMRVTIPFEIRQFISITKKDYIEWEIDTIKKTMKGTLRKDDSKRK